MSSTPFVLCPGCSAKADSPVPIQFPVTMTEVKDQVVARDGRFIQITVQCPKCQSQVRITQHATQDERDGSYAIL